MALDYEKMHKAIKEFPNTPEGQEFFRKMREKDEIKEKRYRRFEEWLKHNDFDKLMLRLIHEHDDEYEEKCYHNGYMPHPNNKLSFLIDYVVHNYAEVSVSELDSDFSNQIWFFKGYYIQLIFGQGTLTRIINKDDKSILLQLG